MSEYLLNIAARSAGNGINDLLPSTPAFSAADSGIVGDFAEEKNIPNATVHEQFVQQSIAPVQLHPLPEVQKAAISNRKEIKEQEKNMETSYFSRYIERVNPEEENNRLKYKSIETTGYKFEEPSQKSGAENEPIFLNKTISKFIPGKEGSKKHTSNKTADKLLPTVPVDETMSDKKQVIDPVTANGHHQKYKLLPTSSVAERITPNQPDQLTKRPVQTNKIKEPAPKLIIGKIIVEIMPAKLPAPQKIITRIVQSPLKDSFQKPNKLSFGLGQL